MAKKSSELVQQRFKGRIETYYVLSKQNLANLGFSSFFGDFLFLVGSLLLGFYFNNGPKITGVGGVVALLVSFGFYFRKYLIIWRTVKSDDIDFLNPNDKKLKIIKATWEAGTKTSDVTDNDRTQVVDNQLLTKASITVFGDPFPHEYKFLIIKYKLGDDDPETRKYKEESVVAIPR